MSSRPTRYKTADISIPSCHLKERKQHIIYDTPRFSPKQLNAPGINKSYSSDSSQMYGVNIANKYFLRVDILFNVFKTTNLQISK